MHIRWRAAGPRILLTAAVLVGGAVLAACGGDGTDSSAGGPATSTSQQANRFNDADVEFAQNMIPHHEQAVVMADLVATRAASPQIKQLGTQIKAAQAPEIATLKSWLSEWGKPTAPPGGHGGHQMPGMMAESDMGKLEAAKGAEFDRMFAEMMIAHHEGAVEMARTEQSEGAHAKAKEMAATIEKSQTAEIATMRQLTG